MQSEASLCVRSVSWTCRLTHAGPASAMHPAMEEFPIPASVLRKRLVVATAAHFSEEYVALAAISKQINWDMRSCMS